MHLQSLIQQAVDLLKKLIATPSFSGEEERAADILCGFLLNNGVRVCREKNNVWAVNKNFDPHKPTTLLNSHLDTVKPSNGWTKNPFEPVMENGKLFGLGSNDAGASLVSLLAVFLHFYNRQDLKYNLIYSATAEEETSGKNGIGSVLNSLGPLKFAMVGEPTSMMLATAEKGLIVLHCETKGISGHAARDIGENAIISAMQDIQWLGSYQFPKISRTLGPVKISVTGIEGGTLHNVIPDCCKYTVDIRTNEQYTNEQIVAFLKENIKASIVRCSLRLQPSFIREDHPFIQCAKKMGIPTFGSPTISDQAFLDCPSVKMGPGLSRRSHTADEFVCLSEIENGIQTYINYLNNILQ